MPQLLIQLSHLSKSFHSFSLFEEISFSIHEGDVFALIGENGAGKTTLLHLLMGLLNSDAGSVYRLPYLTIGFLPQEVTFEDANLSVRTYLEGSFVELERQMVACLENPDRLAEWAELHEKYEQLGGYRRLPVEKILEGLKLKTDLLDSPLSIFSSGQKVRIALAKALVDNPHLLLLDEPTNHLDVDMISWLEQVLSQRSGATVIVSHDRRFLNATCKCLLELKKGELTCYGGSYDFYLAEQERLLDRQMKAYEKQENERSLLKQKIKAMTFSRGKASPPTDRNFMAYDGRGEQHQKSLQRHLGALKTRLEEIESNRLLHPKPKSIKGLRFSPSPLASSVAIELDQISKAFGEKKLFCGLSRTISKGERILVKGPNGAGKTTLLRCIMGLLPIDEGQIRYASTAKIAYLDQEIILLPMEKTPLQHFNNRFNLSEEELRRELHMAALGGAELLHRPFALMSVGQRKRMMLLQLILEKPNVLLLDEPTNHLDFLTLEALETALLQFEGAILAISHDTTFVRKIATQEWILFK